jgi:hypothetical protein
VSLTPKRRQDRFSGSFKKIASILFLCDAVTSQCVLDWMQIMDGSQAIMTAIVTVFTGLIVAMLSFIGARMGSKETSPAANRKNRFDGDMKIAQYRLEWIQDLRSEFIAADKIMTRHYLIDSSDIKETAIQLSERMSNIGYKMNPKDKNYNNIIDCLRTMIDVILPKKREDALAARNKFMQISQEVLKSEWDRLYGEIRNAGHLEDSASSPKLFFRRR